MGPTPSDSHSSVLRATRTSSCPVPLLKPVEIKSCDPTPYRGCFESMGRLSSNDLPSPHCTPTPSLAWKQPDPPHRAFICFGRSVSRLSQLFLTPLVYQTVSTPTHAPRCVPLWDCPSLQTPGVGVFPLPYMLNFRTETACWSIVGALTSHIC